MTNRANQNWPSEMYDAVISDRTKIWNDRNYAEQWIWNGTNVLRYRTRTTDNWTYRIGEFTTEHMPYADRRDRAMTAEEIEAFKASPVCKPAINPAYVGRPVAFHGFNDKIYHGNITAVLARGVQVSYYVPEVLRECETSLSVADARKRLVVY